MRKRKPKWRSARITKMRKSAPALPVRIAYRERYKSATVSKF